MKFEVILSDEAKSDIEKLKKSGNKKALKKLYDLLKELESNPKTGTGRPEQLNITKSLLGLGEFLENIAWFIVYKMILLLFWFFLLTDIIQINKTFVFYDKFIYKPLLENSKRGFIFINRSFLTTTTTINFYCSCITYFIGYYHCSFKFRAFFKSFNYFKIGNSDVVIFIL